jgi:heterodisulfide reductase subunit C
MNLADCIICGVLLIGCARHYRTEYLEKRAARRAAEDLKPAPGDLDPRRVLH